MLILLALFGAKMSADCEIGTQDWDGLIPGFESA